MLKRLPIGIRRSVCRCLSGTHSGAIDLRWCAWHGYEKYNLLPIIWPRPIYLSLWWSAVTFQSRLTPRLADHLDWDKSVLPLVNWCFNRESKTYLCTSDKAGIFSNKKYDSYKCWTCAELCEAFTLLMENIYVQWRHGLSTNSGDSNGHKLCSIHSGFVFILLWEGFYV